MSTAYLGLGSNVNAHEHIVAGIAALRHNFSNVCLSPVYQSRAVGFDGDDFLNLVASVETSLEPVELKHYLNDLEDRYGRKRNAAKFSDRTLDVDILLYDDLYIISPVLQIPRPEILTFSHVLKPLADLAPNLVHPASRKTIGEIWQAYPGDRNALREIDL
jgi:2-amino-4-hydroxy-6-hydroxymethyldihydropteridine diphosphokinase